MIVKEITHACDLCKRVVPVIKIKYPVLFITSQNDGSSTEPYISYENIEVCEECLKKIVLIIGEGCMGNNTYKYLGDSFLKLYWKKFKFPSNNGVNNE